MDTVWSMDPEGYVAITFGVIGALIGAGGLVRATRANLTAEEALVLAKSAEERADRLETFSTEKRDVTWAQVQPPTNTAHCRIQNTGTDPAFDVRLFVDPLEDPTDRHEVHQDRVDPTGLIELDLEDLWLKANPWGRNSMNARYGFVVNARVTWKSASGFESVQELGRLKFV